MRRNRPRQASFLDHEDEIEALAIEALERARMLPPGIRRHELLKEAGRMRVQAMAAELMRARDAAVLAASDRLRANGATAGRRRAVRMAKRPRHH